MEILRSIGYQYEGRYAWIAVIRRPEQCDGKQDGDLYPGDPGQGIPATLDGRPGKDTEDTNGNDHARTMVQSGGCG